MSPEQIDPARFGAVGPRTDVWGLGATLFTALTGERPFEARSPAVQAVAIVTREAPDLESARPDVPGWLARLAADCLNKRSEDRPSMARVLEALSGGPSSAPKAADQVPEEVILISGELSDSARHAAQGRGCARLTGAAILVLIVAAMVTLRALGLEPKRSGALRAEAKRGAP